MSLHCWLFVNTDSTHFCFSNPNMSCSAFVLSLASQTQKSPSWLVQGRICHSSLSNKHPSMWPWKLTFDRIRCKFYISHVLVWIIQDVFLLEAKLCKWDILVHIVLRLLHPCQLDLKNKNMRDDLLVIISAKPCPIYHLLIGEPKTLKLNLAILFVHWEPVWLR